MNLDQVIRAKGAFRAELEPTPFPKTVLPDPKEASTIIILVELIPWSQDDNFVHLIVQTFCDKISTIKPIRRDSVREWLSYTGKLYEDRLVWSPAVIIAKPKRRSKRDPKPWVTAFQDRYDGSVLLPKGCKRA